MPLIFQFLYYIPAIFKLGLSKIFQLFSIANTLNAFWIVWYTRIPKNIALFTYIFAIHKSLPKKLYRKRFHDFCFEAFA